MPWRECSVMDERVRFIGRLLDGEGMSKLCREFGISRKTGYKIFNRYRLEGVEALTDRSRRPVRYANQLTDQVEAMIVRLKTEKPHWGARKIRELLVQRLNGDVRVPAKSTVHAVLDRHGLVKRARQRRRFTAEGTALSAAIAPNDLWCADFKGEFKLGNGRYCYPLTVTDQASRMLLACEALETTKEDGVFKAFQHLFTECGLPNAIRSDNGLPFASPNGLYNLSKLSVWWLRLGIALGRIRPGHPKAFGDVMRPASLDLAKHVQQLRRLDRRNGLFANIGKNIAFQPADDSPSVFRRPSVKLGFMPFPRHCFERVLDRQAQRSLLSFARHSRINAMRKLLFRCFTGLPRGSKAGSRIYAHG